MILFGQYYDSSKVFSFCYLHGKLRLIVIANKTAGPNFYRSMLHWCKGKDLALPQLLPILG